MNTDLNNFLPSPTTSDAAIGGGMSPSTVPSGIPAAAAAQIKDNLVSANNLAGGAPGAGAAADIQKDQAYVPGDPNPPGAPKSTQAEVSTFVASGGSNGPSGTGNPYFAPNVMAILSAAMYKFYDAMRESELGMADVTNKSMKESADMAQSIASQQIAAGQAESEKDIGQAVLGGLQAAGGAFSLGMVGGAFMKGISKSGAIKDAENEMNAAKGPFDESVKNVEGSTKTYNESVAKLGQSRADRDEAIAVRDKLQTKLDNAENPPKTQDAASTDPSTTPPAQAAQAGTGSVVMSDADKASLKTEINKQQKTIDEHNSKVRKDKTEVAQNKDNLDNQKYSHDIVDKDYQAKAKNYSDMKSRQYEELNQAAQVTQAVSQLSGGVGQLISGVISSQADIAKSIAEANITIGQTELQNIGKSSDAASQAQSGTRDSMNSLISALDQTVQKTNEANRVV